MNSTRTGARSCRSQPVGTCLSYSRTKKWAKSDAEVNAYFYGYLTDFFSIHVHNYLLKGSDTVDVYFAGESHAGHYIPSMIEYMNEGSRAAAASTL